MRKIYILRGREGERAEEGRRTCGREAASGKAGGGGREGGKESGRQGGWKGGREDGGKGGGLQQTGHVPQRVRGKSTSSHCGSGVGGVHPPRLQNVERGGGGGGGSPSLEHEFAFGL
jgi:hypothetical protein